MASKLFNLLALSTLALFLTTFSATPVNALAAGHQDNVLRRHAAHDSLAAKKRSPKKRDASSTKRCKPRPSSAALSSSTDAAPSSTDDSAPASSSTFVAPTTTAAPAPTTSDAPAPAPTTSAAAASPPSNNGGASSKLCLAWANGDGDSLSTYKAGSNPVLYTWSPNIPDNAASLGFSPAPMLWGPDQASDFASLVVGGYATIAMGFNEPNEPGQSNMSPEQGAQLWQQYIEPLRAQGYKTISPATSSNPNGLTWVQNMLSACNGGCTFDAVAVHWYDVTAQSFIDYVNLWHTTFNKPIWVTEYACQNFNGGAQCSMDDIWSFSSTVVNFMNGADFVEHFCPFGFMQDMQNVNPDNALMKSDGSGPTDLGFAYLNGSL